MSVERMRAAVIAMALVLCLAPSPALAYVGPGSGLSAIGAAFALVGAVLLAIAGFIWYPVKRLLQRSRRRPKASRPAADSPAS